MKRILLTLLFPFSVAQAQYVTISDPQMQYFLQTVYPSCITGSQLDTTCSSVVNASYLSLNSWNIADLNGIQYFKNLLTLDVSNNPATVIPGPLPTTLEQLTAEDIAITSLPPLPPALTTLHLKNNPISTLPALPSTLIDLTCDNLNLTSLPTLPSSLFFLNVQHNNLTSLPALPSSLGALIIYNNQVSTLPALPASLTNLQIQVNNITTLPTLPATLNFLDVSNNPLSGLPASLPANLQTFRCGYCGLSSLPPLPSPIVDFTCSGNNLTSLPALPPNLIFFYCNNNQLGSLPVLPESITYMYCQNNVIAAIDSLPDSLTYFNCSNNQLSCFPPLPTETGHFFTLFPNPATCLPNYGAWMNSTLLSYPLCVIGDSLNNASNCMNGTGLYGYVFKDQNSDCNFNLGDLVLPNLPMKLYNGGTLLQQSVTTATGNYYFNPGNGSFDIRLDSSAVPYLQRACAGGFSQAATLSAGAPVISGLDYDLECNGLYDLGVQSAFHNGLVFPGQHHQLRVHAGDLSQWHNLHCASGVSGQIVITVNGPVSFVAPLSGAATPAIAGNVYTYTVSDYGSFDIYTQIGLEVAVDTTATSADSVCVTIDVQAAGQDTDTTNDSYSFCYPIFNSYDPNMKEVDRGDLEVGTQPALTYTVHFQNTGNAPALHIVVRDTLDASLDLSSFEWLGQSHPGSITLNGSVLTVDFPNINLPDSSVDFYGSMGHFQYRVKPVSGLSAGTIIQNTAHIFFDFNAPIVTNTTENEYMIGVGTPDVGLTSVYLLYPNPASHQMTIQCSNPSRDNRTMYVYDLQGKCVMHLSMGAKEQMLVNTQRLENGMYLFTLNNESGVQTQGKFVIQH